MIIMLCLCDRHYSCLMITCFFLLLSYNCYQHNNTDDYSIFPYNNLLLVDFNSEETNLSQQICQKNSLTWLWNLDLLLSLTKSNVSKNIPLMWNRNVIHSLPHIFIVCLKPHFVFLCSLLSLRVLFVRINVCYYFYLWLFLCCTGCFAFWCFPCFTCITAKNYGECLCLPLLEYFSGFIPAITMSMRVSMRQRYNIKVRTQFTQQLESFEFQYQW